MFKKLGLPAKKAPTISTCLNTKKELIFSLTAIANTFKKHFTNLTSDLVKKLPDSTGSFLTRIHSVGQYYKGFNCYEKNLNLKNVVQC